jgi:hypothetical protein
MFLRKVGELLLALLNLLFCPEDGGICSFETSVNYRTNIPEVGIFHSKILYIYRTLYLSYSILVNSVSWRKEAKVTSVDTSSLIFSLRNVNVHFNRKTRSKNVSTNRVLFYRLHEQGTRHLPILNVKDNLHVPYSLIAKDQPNSCRISVLTWFSSWDS